MVDVLEALGEEVGGSFFTANPACTEEGDVFVLVGIEMGGDVLRKFVEGVVVRIDRTCEGADFDFVMIAGIDRHYFGIGDECVPVLGFDIGTDEIGGIDGRNTQGDNFFFESDFEPVEWQFSGDRFFVF